MNQIAKKESNDVAVPQVSNVVTPMSMLQAAREQNASLEQMQQLMDMQFKWEANEARKAFFRAVADFKSAPIHIRKDKENKQYNSKYTGIGNLVNTVNAELSKYGLSASWTIDQTDKIQVTCVLSHAQGHSEKVSLTAVPDASGQKNPIQQIKSTITYLKIATYEAVTGVASTDDPGDDDGNTADVKLISDVEAADLNALIQEVKADKVKFLNHFKIDKVESLPAAKHKQAISMLEKKRKAS